jgi:hypothetical protein
MGPVRVGNDAWRQPQNDVYGSVVLACSQWFFDQRIALRSYIDTLYRLEPWATRRCLWLHRQMPACGNFAAVNTYTSIAQ